MKLKTKRQTKCKHLFEIVSRRYDHWDALDYFVIFCPKCGDVRKIEIEGANIYVSKLEKRK